MRRRHRNPHCAINVAVEALGDQWSLLVLRDIVFYGKHEFGEFLAGEERITTSVLADRLAALVDERIVVKTRSTTDRRRERYDLTEKGFALIPVLVELGTWGTRYGPHVTPHSEWARAADSDPARLHAVIRATVKAGGSAFRGPRSVLDQLRADE
jgi:DNA-binding HxlR family transcriptional regulator